MTVEELIAARRAEPWREALRKGMKNKERSAIERVKMNELEPYPPGGGEFGLNERTGDDGGASLS